MASGSGTISATQTEQKIDIDARHLLLINDGANTVYISITQTGETAKTATTSDFPLKKGEAWLLDSDRTIDQISLICAAAETASVRYAGWV